MTARLPGSVSAVTTTASFHSTGEDQPLPSSIFHSVSASEMADGRPLVSATPVPFGPRKRLQSAAVAEDAMARRQARAEVAFMRCENVGGDWGNQDPMRRS